MVIPPGVLVGRLAVFGLLISDDAIELIGIELDLDWLVTISATRAFVTECCSLRISTRHRRGR